MSTWDYQVQLIGLVEGVNENGFPEIVEEPKEPIFANRLSIRSNEYWQSQKAGVNLAYTFEIHSFEYNGEEKLLHDEKEYKIERTYNKGDVTELICSRKADNHDV